jgi:hypothetical protein
MSTVFISYRRQSAPGEARAWASPFAEQFGDPDAHGAAKAEHIASHNRAKDVVAADDPRTAPAEYSTQH